MTRRKNDVRNKDIRSRRVSEMMSGGFCPAGQCEEGMINPNSCCDFPLRLDGARASKNQRETEKKRKLAKEAKEDYKKQKENKEEKKKIKQRGVEKKGIEKNAKRKMQGNKTKKLLPPH